MKKDYKKQYKDSELIPESINPVSEALTSNRTTNIYKS